MTYTVIQACQMITLCQKGIADSRQKLLDYDKSEAEYEERSKRTGVIIVETPSITRRRQDERDNIEFLQRFIDTELMPVLDAYKAEAEERKRTRAI